MSTSRSLLAALLVARGAAGSAAEPPPPAALPPVLPSSSVAAVLARRDALGLTPEQVKALEGIQARLEKERQAATEAAFHPADAPGGPGSSPPPRPTGGGQPPQAGGMMGGGKTRPPPHVPEKKGDAAQALAQRFDELDTAAFLEAVELLPESKREQATDVASRYREQLYEQRQRDARR